MNPTNFLNMCKIAARLRGIPGNGPSSVDGQTGSLERVVNDIANAWVEIQESRDDWGFMWGEFSFTTSIAIDEYTAPITNDEINRIKHPLFIQDLTVGLTSRRKMVYVPWEDFRHRYIGSAVSGAPSHYTIEPTQKKIVIRDVPAHTNWQIDGEFYRDSQTLGESASPNTETTLLRTAENWVVIYRANAAYAGYEEIPDLFKTSTMEFNSRNNNLLRKYVMRNNTMKMRPMA